MERIYDFARAYTSGGIFEGHILQQSEADDIHKTSFRNIQGDSNRTASKPRDYIFATMPQFHWYHPPTNTKQMSFSNIFVDLYRQAFHSGHAFVPRITRSMIDSSAPGNGGEVGWEVSQVQPEPTCLGDFLKLLGQRLPDEVHSPVDYVHLTAGVAVFNLANAHADAVLMLIETSISFSRSTWQKSHRGGELSKYGSYPREDWQMDSLENTGSFPEGPRRCFSAGATLLQLARMILDQMCCAMQLIHLHPSREEDWIFF